MSRKTLSPANLQYLSSAPSGPTLQIGDVYYDTSLNTIRIYTGSVWIAADTNAGLLNTANTFTASQIIQPTSTSAVGLIVKGVASQTANLQEWQNSAGTILARVSSGGAFVTSAVGVFGAQSNTPNAQLYVLANSITYPTLVAKAIASQTANLTEWQDSSGGALSYVGPTGVLTLNNGNSTPPATYSLIVKRTSFFDTGDAASVGIIVRARASQTANLTEWQNSAGTVLGSISSTGKLTSAVDASINGITVGMGLGSISTNTAIGLAALGSNTTGSSNTALGDHAGTSNTSTVDNTYIGRNAGYYSYGNRNVFIGSGSAYNGGSGSNNTYIGTLTGTGNNYSGVVFIGYSAGQNTTGDNQLVIANTNTATPLIGGDFSVKTLSFAGNTTITSQATGTAGLIVKGVASQTANLQEWQNSAGTVLAAVEPNGSFYGSSITAYGVLTSNSSFRVNNAAAGTVAAIVKGAASQTANLQEWQNSAGTVLTSVDKDGVLNAPIININSAGGGIYNVSSGSYITFTGSGIQFNPYGATKSGLIVRGATSQTANLQEWQNSAGTVLAKVDKDGNFSNVATYGTIATTTLSATGGNITTTYGLYSNLPASTNAGIAVMPWAADLRGAIVRGAASQTADLQQWQNSAGTVLAKVQSNGVIDTSQYLNMNTVANAGIAVGGLYRILFATSGIATQINSSGASNIVAVVRGAASQTGSLQEWQNSSGTVLAAVNSVGGLYTSNDFYVSAQAYFYSAADYGSSVNVVTRSTSATGIIVRGRASQTANLQEWQDSSGTVLGSIGAKGNISFASTTIAAPSAEFVINASNPYPAFLVRTAGGSWINYVTSNGTTMYNSTLIAANLATQIPLTVKGAASQTANLQEWQNSAGTVLAYVNAIGDGIFSNVVTTNDIKAYYGKISSNAQALGVSLGQISATTSSASTIGLVIRGTTSQTANLQEWQNSAGTVLSAIDVVGNFTKGDGDQLVLAGQVFG